MEERRPYSEKELAYAEAFRDHLTLGELEPDDSHLDAERAALIRRELRRLWRERVRLISRRGKA